MQYALLFSDLQLILALMAPHPPHRALVLTTSAAGLRVREVGPLPRTDSERDRGLRRVPQGTGRKDRYPLRSTRLWAARRAYGQLERPAPWLLPGQDRANPLPLLRAQRLSARAQHAATLQHGTGLHTLRHAFAPHGCAAGVAPRTLQRWLGHRSCDPTTRSFRGARPPLAHLQSPWALLRVAPLPPRGEDCGHGAARQALPPSRR
jgi:integrase/recombinase XerD